LCDGCISLSIGEAYCLVLLFSIRRHMSYDIIVKTGILIDLPPS